MKTADFLTVLLGVGVAGAAAWLFSRGAFGRVLAPPQAEQYQPRTNPNGYVFIPYAGGGSGGAWQKVSPNGEVAYWTDVL